MPSFTFVSTANAFVLRGAMPGLRRHPSRTRSTSTRPGSRRRSRRARRRSCRSTTPGSAATWTRSWTSRAGTTSSSSRTRRRASSPTTAAGRSAASATWRPSRSTRRRTSSRARAARCSSTTRGSSSAPRSSGRRAPTGASSSAARSTSTPGSTSARRTCRARSSPPSCGRRWRRRRASRTGAWRSGPRTTRPWRTWNGRADLRRPIIPADRSHNAHMYYLLLPDLARRTAFIDRLKANDIQSVFHYIPLHSSPFGRYGRSLARRHVEDRRRQRPARQAAPVARARGSAPRRDRRGHRGGSPRLSGGRRGRVRPGSRPSSARRVRRPSPARPSRVRRTGPRRPSRGCRRTAARAGSRRC